MGGGGPRKEGEGGGVASASATWLLIGTMIALAPCVVQVFELSNEVTENEAALAGLAVVVMSGLFGVCVRGLKMLNCQGPLVLTGFFVFTCWSATVDVVLSSAAMGFTSLGKFYLFHGEEYFKSPWGLGSLLWDGSTHLALQAIIAEALIRGKPCGVALLVWSGSIINSMPVLLLGAATGSFSSMIKPSICLNTPYLFVPLAITPWVLSQASSSSSTSAPTSKRIRANLGLEALFALFHCAFFVLHIVRATVVLDGDHALARSWLEVEPVLKEQSGFARLQVLQNFFFLCLWHLFAIAEALSRVLSGKASSVFGGSLETASKVYWFMAGVVLQGQFGFFMMLLSRVDVEPDLSLVADTTFATDHSIGINIVLAVFPLLQALIYQVQMNRLTTKQE